MKFNEDDFLKYFTYSEFDSPDADGSGKSMDKKFLAMLTEARELARIPFIITSGFRTKEHNEDLIRRGYQASPNSSHMKGVAADIFIANDRSRYKILNALITVGFRRIGIGSRFIHVDIDQNKNQNLVWTYKK